MPVFRLAHLSDPHLPPPPLRLRQLRLKQKLSWFAWRRKRHRHDAAILARITADMSQLAPDHIAITGDLTNFSTAAEFARATDWLRTLGPASDITISPGNHDALVNPPTDDPFALWRPWLGDATDGSFPFVRRRGPIALFNLCSAVPTDLHRAQGELGTAQIARLGTALQAAGAAGLVRIVLIHHPVTAGVVKPRSSLIDAAPLQATLRASGAELVLHGHAHRAVVATIPGPHEPIPVLGVPSASAVPGHGDSARWHLIEIETEAANPAMRVIARGLDGDGQIRELGRYRLACGLTDSAARSASYSLQPSH